MKHVAIIAFSLLSISSWANNDYAASQQGLPNMGMQGGQPAMGQMQRPDFSVIDLNQDGQVTLDEFKQHRIPHGEHETVFHHIDANQDGRITRDEFENHKPPRPPHMQRPQ